MVVAGREPLGDEQVLWHSPRAWDQSPYIPDPHTLPHDGHLRTGPWVSPHMESAATLTLDPEPQDGEKHVSVVYKPPSVSSVL